MPMRREEADAFAVVKDVLSAIPVVHVPIDDEDAIEVMPGQGMCRGDGHIVEQAEPHRGILEGMMPRRTSQDERSRHSSRQNRIGGGNRRTGRFRRDLERPPSDMRIGLDPPSTFAAKLLDGCDVIPVVGESEIVECGGPVLQRDELRGLARRFQPLVDRFQAQGRLGVPAAAVVLLKHGVGDQAGRFDRQGHDQSPTDSLELCFLGDDLLTSFECFLFCGWCVLCVSFVSLLLLCFEPTFSVCVVSRGFFTGNALFLNRRLGLKDIGICL